MPRKIAVSAVDNLCKPRVDTFGQLTVGDLFTVRTENEDTAGAYKFLGAAVAQVVPDEEPTVLWIDAIGPIGDYAALRSFHPETVVPVEAGTKIRRRAAKKQVNAEITED